MAYALGMLLGAFFIPYCFYGWRYLDDDEPFKWYHLIWPLDLIWKDIYFHSRASFRRALKNLKTIAPLVLFGAWIGWGIADGLMRFF
jgi:hypothetical protein